MHGRPGSRRSPWPSTRPGRRPAPSAWPMSTASSARCSSRGRRCRVGGGVRGGRRRGRGRGGGRRRRRGPPGAARPCTATPSGRGARARRRPPLVPRPRRPASRCAPTSELTAPESTRCSMRCRRGCGGRRTAGRRRSTSSLAHPGGRRRHPRRRPLRSHRWRDRRRGLGRHRRGPRRGRASGPTQAGAAAAARAMRRRSRAPGSTRPARPRPISRVSSSSTTTRRSAAADERSSASRPTDAMRRPRPRRSRRHVAELDRAGDRGRDERDRRARGRAAGARGGGDELRRAGPARWPKRGARLEEQAPTVGALRSDLEVRAAGTRRAPAVPPPAVARGRGTARAAMSPNDGTAESPAGRARSPPDRHRSA